MLEPQGTVFFLILMAIFAGLLAWVVLAKQIVFRVLAACLAFIPAMLFGVAAVNKYYDYYQTWGSVAADFTNQGVATLPQVPHLAGKVGGGINKLGLSPAGPRGGHPDRIPFRDHGEGPPEPDLPRSSTSICRRNIS